MQGRWIASKRKEEEGGRRAAAFVSLLSGVLQVDGWRLHLLRTYRGPTEDLARRERTRFESSW